jgi:hypothetical protein
MKGTHQGWRPARDAPRAARGWAAPALGNAAVGSGDRRHRGRRQSRARRAARPPGQHLTRAGEAVGCVHLSGRPTCVLGRLGVNCLASAAVLFLITAALPRQIRCVIVGVLDPLRAWRRPRREPRGAPSRRDTGPTGGRGLGGCTNRAGRARGPTADDQACPGPAETRPAQKRMSETPRPSGG